MSSHDEKVVDLPVSPEERQRRLMVEVHRLAGLTTVDWTYQLQHRAEYFTERFGLSSAEMKTLVLACLKDIEKAKAEDRRIEQRAQRDKEKAKHEEERKAEKDAGRKAKEKAKALADVAELPRDQRDPKIAELAESFDEEVEELQREITGIIATECSVPSDWDVEAWGEPVTAAALLQELIVKVNKHAVMQPHQALAVALWVMLAWVHEVAAYFSPYLFITAPDIDSGKSTLGIDTVGKLVPRPFSMGEPTAAVIFRTADEHKPTFLCDDVDTIFRRKPDLTSIFNVAWKRGPKIPRMMHGTTRWFDPFCPKVCTMVGTDIPRPLLSRCVLIKMKPKLVTEKIEEAVKDDDEFRDLRRKLKRWSDDNAPGLKDAPPATDFSNNRERNNWNLQLAIATLAGASWRKQALQAAELLTRSMRKPSWLQLLLAAFEVAFKKSRNKNVTSQEFFTGITADELSIWHEYNRGTGVITQRQIAHLLRELDPPIYPTSVGPKRLQGYRFKDFDDAFDRYRVEDLGDPLIPSGGKK